MRKRDLRRLATGAVVSLALHASLIGLGSVPWGIRGIGIGSADTSPNDAADAVVVTRRQVQVTSAQTAKATPKIAPRVVPKVAAAPAKVLPTTPPSLLPSPLPTSAPPSPPTVAPRKIAPSARRAVPLSMVIPLTRPMNAAQGMHLIAPLAQTPVLPTFRSSHRHLTRLPAGAPAGSSAPAAPPSGANTNASTPAAQPQPAQPTPNAAGHNAAPGDTSPPGTAANAAPPAPTGGAGRGVPFASGNGGGGAGLGPDAARVAYVLDVSESMNENDKIGAARTALLQAIGGLRASDHFTIILFSDDVTPLSSGLIAASDTAAVKRLEDRFVATAPYGETDLSDALDAAFNLSGIQRIFLISDGAPTRGINDYDALRAHLRERNLGGRVRISTYALGAGEQFEGVQLLRQIAEENNGEYRYVKIGG